MLVADAPLIDPALEPIRERVLAGERLGYDDGVALYRTRDLFTLGELANVVRERLHGRNVYYNINRHINYTNYCVLRCKFCAFYRALDGKSGLTELSNTAGYAYSLDEIVEIAADAERAGATEVHIVGGLHPKLPFEFYTDLCRAIRQRCPGLHIKAFTAIEIIHFTRISKPRRSIHDVLIALREAGLDSLPGGGAEISTSVSTPKCSRTRSASRAGSTYTARPTRWASPPTRPCFTATSRRRRSASAT